LECALKLRVTNNVATLRDMEILLDDLRRVELSLAIAAGLIGYYLVCAPGAQNWLTTASGTQCCPSAWRATSRTQHVLRLRIQ